MPAYTYRDSSGNEVDQVMSIAEMEIFEKENPDLQRVFKVVRLSYEGDGVSSKLDTDFKSRLKEIKKSYPRSTINTW